ncbi:hypothetical protein [Kitasatospora sp. McL0602]|uniref:hypothetical protein n=1 Tax=Kitasatospora sp. McL0602 TaxID=3439530 RepID=UPI003F8880C1
MMLTLVLLTTPPLLAAALAHSNSEAEESAERTHRGAGPGVLRRHSRTGGRHALRAVRPTGPRTLA